MSVADDLRSEQAAFNLDDDAFDLFRAATLIGRIEEPGVNVEAVSRSIGELVARVRARMDGSADPDWPTPLVALAGVLFDEDGFRGNTEHYDDPANSFVHRVLETRRGLPITLSMITCEVARRVGIDAYGIAFPGHFLVGIHFLGPDGDRDLVVIDPFHGGRLRTRDDLARHLRRMAGRDVPLGPEHLAPATPRVVLERMLNNLRTSYARRSDPVHLSRVLARLLLLRPGHAGLLLERARARRVLLDERGARADAEEVLTRGREGQREAAAALLRLLGRERRQIH